MISCVCATFKFLVNTVGTGKEFTVRVMPYTYLEGKTFNSCSS